MLYLDHKQELELDIIKEKQQWQYEAIMTLARTIKKLEEGDINYEEFYNVNNK